MATTTTTPTQMQTGSKQSADAQQKIEEFRALFADAPELGKKALGERHRRAEIAGV